MSSLVKKTLSMDFLYEHSSPQLFLWGFFKTFRGKYKGAFEPSQASAKFQYCATVSKLYSLMLHYFHFALFKFRLSDVPLFAVTLFNVALFNAAIYAVASIALFDVAPFVTLF